MESNNSLYKEIWIKSSAQKAFDYFTKKEAMLKWHGKEVELNPTLGGVYKIVFEDGTAISGEYLEVEVAKKLIYTAKYDTVESTVSIDFIEENGGVRIKIKHTFSKWQNTSPFSRGWDYFLAILTKIVEP